VVDDDAVLNMLQRYEGQIMDDLIAERPDFSWAQSLLPIDRLSRKNLITLHRVGLSVWAADSIRPATGRTR
jgi:hypothetical protein